MYYDRQLPPAMLSLLEPGQPLAWLTTRVESPWGRQHLAHLQFRRANGARGFGGIELYLGRTSPLEVRARRDGTLELVADPFYRQLEPTLWGHSYTPDRLAGLRTTLESYLEACAAQAHRSFLDGEAVAHAGLMRRYGPAGKPGDLFLAVDSEVRIGYDSRPAREAITSNLRSVLGIPVTAMLPTKLDALGLLADGSVAAVEVKAERGDLARAVTQVAAHGALLAALNGGPERRLEAALWGLARQKAGLGLLVGVPAPSDFRLVPVIAAPDGRVDWRTRWLEETATERQRLAGFLTGLQLWRLSTEGEVLEVAMG